MPSSFLLRPGETVKFHTGFAWEIDAAQAVEVKEALGEPPGAAGIDSPAFPTVEYGLIRDRSSMAAKGVFVVGGVVDGDYRGEVQVMLHNAGFDAVNIVPGQKIAQMIVGVAYSHPVRECDPDEDLGVTERGEAGFGSTGQ
jgi:dUTP pyrophosphatase